MKAIRISLLTIAIVQIVSTLVGAVQLLVVPQWYEPMLAGTAFADQYVAAALLLGVVVGGPQWVAVAVHLRAPQWLPATYTAAGLVMIGWIAGECLVLDSFMWAHALWGGLGVVQVILVSVLLGVLRPADPPGMTTPHATRDAEPRQGRSTVA